MRNLYFAVLVSFISLAFFCKQGLAQGNLEKCSINDDPAWSPLGDQIAFVSNCAGNTDIWVVRLVDSTSVNLTSDSLASDFEPTWSPDGSLIAFISDRSGNFDIWVMQADGSHLVNATSYNPGFNSDINWSPNGNLIAFVGEGKVRSDIWIVASDGSNPINLTSQGKQLYAKPTWGPDSSSVIFEATTVVPDVDSLENQSQIQEIIPSGLWKASIDNMSLVQLIADQLLINPAWSPDGNYVAVSKRLDSGNQDIWAISLDSLSSKQLTETVDRASDPIWSPDSEYIVFTSLSGNKFDIWSVKVDGSELTNLTQNNSNRINYLPTWSPDGSQISFAADSEERLDIWIMEADGSHLVNLTGELR